MRIRNIVKNIDKLNEYDSINKVFSNEQIPFNVLYHNIIPQEERYGLDKYISRLLRIEGHSEVENQYSDNGRTTSTSNGITFTNNSDGTFILNGTSTGTIYYGLGSANNFKLIQGHTYLFISINNFENTPSRFYINTPYVEWKANKVVTIISSTSSTDQMVWFYTEAGQTFNNVKIMPLVVDLTQQYPFDTPTTLTDPRVRRILEKGFIPHNTGTIKNTVIEKIGFKGFNLFDESTIVENYYINNQGVEVSNSEFVHSDFIPVVPDQIYYIKNIAQTIGRVSAVKCYDSEKKYIGNSTIQGDINLHKLLENTKYVIINVLKTELPNQNFNVSSSLNGLYLPHQPDTEIKLPAPVEIGGVGSATNTFDITDTEYVFTRNSFDVDYDGSSDEDWFDYGSGTQRYAIIQNGWNSPSGDVLANILCDKLTTVKKNNIETSLKSISGADYNYNRFIVRIDSSITDVSALKTWLSNNPINVKYQLATPQVIRIPKKHFGWVRLKDLSWARSNNSGTWNNYLFFTQINGISLDTSNLYIHSFLTTSQPLASADNRTTRTSYNYAYCREDSCLTVSDFLAKYGDDILFFETQDEVQDFTDEAICQAGGTVNGYQLKIPQEYQEVEYIESTETQYIDTGIIPTPNTRLDIGVQILQLWNSKYICGYYRSRSQYYLYTQDGKLQYGWSSPFINTIDFDTNKHTYSLYCDTNTSYLEQDGVIVSRQTRTNQDVPTNNFTLFRGVYNGEVNPQVVPQRLYSTQIRESGILVRDFVPCYRKSDNVIGLYDRVEGKFYTNQGTGTFLKGNNVDSAYTCEVLPNIVISPIVYTM